jgi:hypothetical protein
VFLNIDLMKNKPAACDTVEIRRDMRIQLQRERINGIIDHRLFSVYDVGQLIQERIVGQVSCDMTMTRTHQSGPSLARAGCRKNRGDDQS